MYVTRKLTEFPTYCLRNYTRAFVTQHVKKRVQHIPELELHEGNNSSPYHAPLHRRLWITDGALARPRAERRLPNTVRVAKQRTRNF